MRARGFTFVEVMVAMAIVATAMAALIKAAGDYTANTSALRDRTYARWVAANRLTEMRAMREWPDIGKKDGESELAGLTWYWRTETEKVQDPALRQVTVSVRLDKSRSGALFSLTSFVGDPAFAQVPQP